MDYMAMRAMFEIGETVAVEFKRCGSGVGAESQNPIIASFFRNIGYAEQLGSGVRNLYKYSKYYSGKEPEFVEGDVFRITVPLNEEFLEEWQKKQSDIYPTQDFD